MKRILKFTSFVLLVVTSFMVFSLSTKASEVELRIYNWQDYIDEGDEEDPNSTTVIDDWIKDYKDRTGITVKVTYNTFETNEYMFNVLKSGSDRYDLVCPSDYIIQKMISLDMLEKFNYNETTGYLNVENYNDYGSHYVKSIFENTKTKNKTTNEELSWANYSIPYMWGTMGFVYDSDAVSLEDASTWNILWNENYKGMGTAKDSVHDTYVAGVMYVYQDELNALREVYENSDKSETSKKAYNAGISSIMNRFDDETIEKVKVALLEMRKNFYGFEVDNGKTDITGGKIKINFAWSGDAVYAMDTADESSRDLTLNYSVPIEGSNVFFDGWVMPKGANVELAEDFLNFICAPSIAARNMNAIGYTSAIAGDEIWELANEWYGSEDGESVDLSYFFEGTIDESYLTNGKAIIKVSERGRQFDAQYPTEEVILRCAIMEDFGDSNEKVLAMWEVVKAGEVSIFLYIGLGILVLGGVGFFIYKVNSNKIRKSRKNKK